MCHYTNPIHHSTPIATTTTSAEIINPCIIGLILGFLFLAAVNSLGYIPADVSLKLKDISKFLMVASLAAIGLNTNIKDMKMRGHITLSSHLITVGSILKSGTPIMTHGGE